MIQITPQLILLRHFPTEWNVRKLYQGQTDVPLSEDSRHELQNFRVLEEFNCWRLFSSPLSRARETAEILFGRSPILIKESIEQSFGSLEALPIQATSKPQDSETDFGWKGLDDRPEGGESVRDVQKRARTWLQRFYRDGENGVLITHKGVIQALMADAMDWPMTGKRPYKIDFTKAQRLQIFEYGQPRVLEMNMSLLESRSSNG